MNALKLFSDDRQLYQILEPSLSDTDCNHYHINRAAQEFILDHSGQLRVLDLGCGQGRSREFFKKLDPEVIWLGCDIHSSPEVDLRVNSEQIVDFDGINIPFGRSSFDLIYCNQVLEHVRHPEPLLRSARKVINDHGVFIGQTSHLEPYHSYSIFNYTPYGIFKVLSDNGFALTKIQAGIDCSSIIKRRFCNRDKFYGRFFGAKSPMQVTIERISKKLGYTAKQCNYLKLLYSGQYVFWARPA